MKKWMCVCVTAMLAVSALAGCSGRSGSSDAAAKTTKAGMETRTEADTKADTKAETKGQAGTGETSDPEGQAGDGWISSEDLQAAAGEHHVKITVRDYGTISVTLDGDKAPITVANYLKLAKDGFYDGLTFHRIIDGFMIQGGCPDGTGMGGPGYSIKGEFTQNGFANNLVHDRGVLSMARAMSPNSAGSQFFIMVEKAPHLDGQYAAFGKVVAGMDVVDKIASVPTDWNDKPKTPVKMKTVELIEG